jgi:hypothetical protein
MFADDQGVRDHIQLQLGRLIAIPMITIGALSAVMVWELEHVGSIVLATIVALTVVAARQTAGG